MSTHQPARDDRDDQDERDGASSEDAAATVRELETVRHLYYRAQAVATDLRAKRDEAVIAAHDATRERETARERVERLLRRDRAVAATLESAAAAIRQCGGVPNEDAPKLYEALLNLATCLRSPA